MHSQIWYLDLLPLQKKKLSNLIALSTLIKFRLLHARASKTRKITLTHEEDMASIAAVAQEKVRLMVARAIDNNTMGSISCWPVIVGSDPQPRQTKLATTQINLSWHIYR